MIFRSRSSGSASDFGAAGPDGVLGALEASRMRTPKRMTGWASADAVSTRVRPSQSIRTSMGPRSALSRLRALCSLDITVPIGQLSTSAISRYERPSTSLSMIIVRALGGKASRALRILSRCSFRAACCSGPPPGSGVVRAHSSSLTRSGPKARAWAPRCAMPVGGDVDRDAKQPGVERRLARGTTATSETPVRMPPVPRPTPPRGRAGPGRPGATPADDTSRRAARRRSRLQRCIAG